MNLNEHSDLKGKHSTFSPSNPAFFNYSPEEFYVRLLGKYRSSLGTDIHEWASISIKRFHKVTSVREMIKDIDSYIFKKYYLEKYDQLTDDGTRILECLRHVSRNHPEVFETVKSYINDAIGFKMKSEVVLFYSKDFFGTADALIFTNNNLRIHDLKTGSGPVHIEQLIGYAALFCLEYHVSPAKIKTELRIYQNNDILVAAPSGDDIKGFMDKYRMFNDIIRTNEEANNG